MGATPPYFIRRKIVLASESELIRMDGYIIEQPQYIEVILDGFWQADKRRDLAEVAARWNERQYTAPDGRPLRFGICRVPGYI